MKLDSVVGARWIAPAGSSKATCQSPGFAGLPTRYAVGAGAMMQIDERTWDIL